MVADLSPKSGRLGHMLGVLWTAMGSHLLSLVQDSKAEKNLLMSRTSLGKW